MVSEVGGPLESYKVVSTCRWTQRGGRGREIEDNWMFVVLGREVGNLGRKQRDYHYVCSLTYFSATLDFFVAYYSSFLGTKMGHL